RESAYIGRRISDYNGRGSRRRLSALRRWHFAGITTFVSSLLLSNFRQGAAADPPLLGGMLCRAECVLRHDKQRTSSEDLSRELLDRRRAFDVQGDIADVDSLHAIRKLSNYLLIDLGVVLARVSDQDELQLRVQLQNVANRRAFMAEVT